MVMVPPLFEVGVVAVEPPLPLVAADKLLLFEPLPLFDEFDDWTSGTDSCKFIETVRSSLIVTAIIKLIRFKYQKIKRAN